MWWKIWQEICWKIWECLMALVILGVGCACCRMPDVAPGISNIAVILAMGFVLLWVVLNKICDKIGEK